MAAIDQLTGLIGVIDAVQGKKTKGTTTTSGTQTTQTNISDKGVQQLIQGILAGPGGVKNVGSAARSSGLYNSTTENMLLGDLYARAANQAELARSPTTTATNQVQSSTMQQGGAGLGTLGTVIGGGMLLNQLFKGGEGILGGLMGGAAPAADLGSLGGSLSGLFGGGATGASGFSLGATPTAGLGGVFGGAAAGAAAGTGTATGAAAGSATGTAAGAAGASGASGAAGGSLGGMGSLGTMALPLGGAFLGGLLGGKDAAKDPMSLGISAGLGALAMGPIGLLAAPLAAVAGGFLSDASVICTALHKQGRISKELHAAGHRYLVSLDPEVRLGYYLWAPEIAKRIDAGSKFWTAVCYVPAYCYLKLLASDRNWLDHAENPIGSLVRFVGEPICKLVAKVHLARKMKEA